MKRASTRLNTVSIRRTERSERGTGVSTSIRIKITEPAESGLPLTHRRPYNMCYKITNDLVLVMKNINGS